MMGIQAISLPRERSRPNPGPAAKDFGSIAETLLSNARSDGGLRRT